MIDITSLGKVAGVSLNTWFIPTMFNALELDNSFVMWSSIKTEYYIDTTNNLLKVKHFGRVRRSFDLNIIIRDDKVILARNFSGNYFSSKEAPEGFRLPRVGDSLMMGGSTYLITNIISTVGDIELVIENQAAFISAFAPSVIFIDGTWEGAMYTDAAGIYYSKHYRSDNVADIYIDGTDIRSIAGAYF